MNCWTGDWRCSYGRIDGRLRPEPPFPKYWIDVAAERIARWFECMELQP